MQEKTPREIVLEVIDRNRYLTLSSTDGQRPWIAPLEYFHDGPHRLYFFSPEDSRHVQHIAQNKHVAVAIFDSEQVGYEPGQNATLGGVQMEAVARSLDDTEYPEAVSAVIEALDPPMPPYVPCVIKPSAFFLSQIVDGVNRRLRVEMTE